MRLTSHQLSSIMLGMHAESETDCHCGADKRGSDHCHYCGCEEYETYCDEIYNAE